MPPSEHPGEFLCPLSGKLLEDPIIAMDGYSYDRDAWQEYVGGKTYVASPLTHAIIPATCVPNFTLRRLVLEPW